MKKQLFINKCYEAACRAWEAFGLNPVVILAQAALESGWGQSTLSSRYNNYFGITAYGKPNDYWNGAFVQLGSHTLKFRCYYLLSQSFFDYARLICSNYAPAAAMSYHPEAFAKEIAYSRYISEVNGDNREAYCRSVVSLCRTIGKLVSEKEVINQKKQLFLCKYLKK
ncbi:MAG: glucosaminidase domain-containing protein [Tannerellaceae bacterium]|nr:glucosaminidase domain-containing protein [Tannerellaceae bacterium]